MNRSAAQTLSDCITIVLQIPTDVDVRVMLTFLELYQTLLGFVLFKLYTDANLTYPPPLDSDKDATAAGVDAFLLREANQQNSTVGKKEVEVEGKKVTVKDVRQTIKSITANSSAPNDDALPVVEEETSGTSADDEFVLQPSKTNPEEAASLPTLQTISSLPESTASKLFAPYTFFLSREVPRPLFEFIARSFGGRVGWPASSGSGSPIDESDESITHFIIDRPLVEGANETPAEKERRRKRKYVQPQWVVDCVNAGKILPEDPYLQGKTLPPHISPFGEEKGAYDPEQTEQVGVDVPESDAESVEDDESMPDADVKEGTDEEQGLVAAVARAAEDPEQLRAAELEAESRGVDFGTFEKKVSKAAKKVAPIRTQAENELEMNKMMMSRKQRKLYEKMKYTEQKRATEVRPIVLQMHTDWLILMIQ